MNMTKLCPKCGSSQTLIGKGKAVHAASLKCAECGRFIKWISKKDLATLLGSNEGGAK